MGRKLSETRSWRLLNLAPRLTASDNYRRLHVSFVSERLASGGKSAKANDGTDLTAMRRGPAKRPAKSLAKCAAATPVPATEVAADQ